MKTYWWWMVILFPAICTAQDFEPVSDPIVVLEQLKSYTDKVNSIQADFEEVRYVSYLKEPQRASGRFIYQKQDKMRWEQQDPIPYIILIDGSSMRVSEDGKEKQIRAAGAMAGTIREMLLMLVNGNYQTHKGFEKEVFQNSKEYRMVLKPMEKRLKQRFDRLEMQFSKSTLGLRQLTFYEKGGDRQVMTFLNEKINVPVETRLFKQF